MSADVESGRTIGAVRTVYEADFQSDERETLLPTTNDAAREQQELKRKYDDSSSNRRPNWTRNSGFCYYAQLAGAFAIGVVCTVLMQLVITNTTMSNVRTDYASSSRASAMAPPYVGSSVSHKFPPATPINKFPELFPSDVGYAGATPTGAEPAMVATAPSYPVHSGAAQLVIPNTLGKPVSDDDDEGKAGKHKKSKFNLFQKWGNLSPWYSIERGRFGVDSGPEPPETCRVTALHFLHRHGARYPTNWAQYGGPSILAQKLHNTTTNWKAEGALHFLNNWTYKLGAEVLTPFGRQQLFDLGVTMRLKYGFLLRNFTETNTLPVFRTESQDRMLASAMNFALGFFGWPVDGQYQQSITIEAPDFNNTLCPDKSCPAARNRTKGDRGIWYVSRWADTYLKDAHERLQKQIEGFELTVEDVYTMQQLCAYETVALGYSKFCELFTEEEWEGFNYALDLYFWYGSAFGSPIARALGAGYVQELVARLTHTPIAVHNTSTNATLDDDPITFPLNQSLYVDATHEVVVLNVITALNLTTFAEQGPLPATHIVHDRKFRASELAPFATNIQFQILECTSVPDPQIRIIINDGVVPLTGIKGCPKQKDGMCPVATFVEAQKEIIRSTDWNWSCYGNWSIPEGTDWNTITGDPPAW